MTGQQLVSIIIRQIEFELEKAGHGLGMPHDTERVARLRHMLREALSENYPAGWRQSGG
jgi:hypothetical protein